MPNPYNNVEVSEEELKNYNISSEEPSDVSPQEQHTAEGGADEVELDGTANIDELDLNEYELVIGDDVFSYDDIQAWKEASDNQTSWQQSNTQKAQELAPMRKLFQAVNDDENFRNHIQSYYSDNPEAMKGFGFDNAYNTGSIPEEQANPQYEELNSRLSVFEEEKGVKELEYGLDTIVRDNKQYFESEQDELDFLDFMIDNGTKDFNQAFKMWSYPKMQEQLESFNKMKGNIERNKGVVQTEGTGAKEVQTPTRFGNYKEITTSHPDVAKYGKLTS
jgi:hypothetical protein